MVPGDSLRVLTWTRPGSQEGPQNRGELEALDVRKRLVRVQGVVLEPPDPVLGNELDAGVNHDFPRRAARAGGGSPASGL